MRFCLDVFFICWAVILILFVVFGQVSVFIGISTPPPKWFRPWMLFVFLYGWTVVPAALIAGVWCLVKS